MGGWGAAAGLLPHCEMLHKSGLSSSHSETILYPVALSFNILIFSKVHEKISIFMNRFFFNTPFFPAVYRKQNTKKKKQGRQQVSTTRPAFTTICSGKMNRDPFFRRHVGEGRWEKGPAGLNPISWGWREASHIHIQDAGKGKSSSTVIC